METIFDINEIKAALLHRYPFLLIDKIIEFEINKSITAVKNVTINEPFFNGHFPDHPVMPGVLILEALAQAAAFLSVKSPVGIGSDKIVYLVGADGFKWKKQVIPGDQLTLRVNFDKNRGPLWFFYCEAHVDGKLVAKGNLSAAIQDRS